MIVIVIAHKVMYLNAKSIGIVSNVCEVKLEQNKISEDLKETLKYKVK